MPDERQTRPVGDFFGPYFTVRLFNLTVEPTQGGLTEEALLANANGGLTQAGQREARFMGLVRGPGGVITSSTGVTLGETLQDLANVGRDTLIDRHLPQVAASLTAESKSGSPFRIQITLTPEYEDALIIMNSRLITYSTIAEVEWGYTTPGPNGERIGTKKYYVRNIYPKMTFGENITITIEGHDLGYEFAIRNSSRKCWTIADATNYFDIIKQLIERNRPYVLSPSSYLDALTVAPAVAETGLFDLLDEGAVVQVGTDWQFITQLLRRFNLSFYVEGNSFVIYSLINPSPDEQNVAYTFRWRQALTGPRDIPVYNATCNILNSFFAPPTSRGVVNVSQNLETGEFTSAFATPRDAPHAQPAEKPTGASPSSDALGSMLSGKSPVTYNIDANGGSITITPEPPTSSEEAGDIVSTPPRRSGDQSPIEERVLALVKEGGIFSAPRIQLKTPGVPDMFPNRIVRLSGFTDIFDGLYLVLNVKHMVSSEGYDMDVEVVRYSAVAATRPDSPPNTKAVGSEPPDQTTINPDDVADALGGG
ncbi:MAG: hypothetical protein AB7L09_00315 [Nitrospira sp.]